MEVFKLHDPIHMINSAALLPLRDVRGAKWNFGRLLAICGSKQMPGAALMACGSALRSPLEGSWLTGAKRSCARFS